MRGLSQVQRDLILEAASRLDIEENIGEQLKKFDKLRNLVNEALDELVRQAAQSLIENARKL